MSGSTGSAEPKACERGSTVSLRLTSVNSQVQFKCGTAVAKLYPDDDGELACLNSDCTTTTTIKDLVALKKPNGNYALTLQHAPQEPRTIYFNCYKEPVVGVSGAEELGPSEPTEFCVVQVSLLAVLKKPSQEVRICSKGTETLSFDITETSKNALFACGENGTLSPPLLDHTFKDPSSTEQSRLSDMLETAQLVESGGTETSPIYTFSVSKLPKAVTNVYYKCIYGDGTGEHKSGKHECKVALKVDAAASTSSDGTSWASPDMKGQQFFAGVVALCLSTLASLHVV
ncbi:SAG-related sequence [Besnoitia besnoiti]|uniref:SAG-related sequence n=1 Tax=Besnoitia besnoiti TaxID=94643 RepID=A0A2A9MMX8_BESBE|nr:SAG-related sequence [Besnoitia besnoiti]PFH36970.1 SAG-related sequence [Besnoitia besnoiti]